MGFDRQTGDLWLGDVGWELWELVHYVERGGNYGWSIVEGPQPVHTDWPRGPTPILPAAIALPHSEAASVTGGYVYRGKRFPELVGAYIFGDWETHRVWAAHFETEQPRHKPPGPPKLLSRIELVEPTLRIVTFAEDHAGELYIVDYDNGTIHTLDRNDIAAGSQPFPVKLSETGVFDSVPDHKTAPGVYPFSIHAELWSDHANAERVIGLPGTSSIIWHRDGVPIPGTIMTRRLEFPKDAVLAKTLSIELEAR